MGNVDETRKHPVETPRRPRAFTTDPQSIQRSISEHKTHKVHHHVSKQRKRRTSTVSEQGITLRAKKLKDRRRGIANRQRVRKNSIRSENDTKYSSSVIEQLVSLGFGTEKECYQASALCSNYRDLNDVIHTLKQIQSRSITVRDSNEHKIIEAINKSTSIDTNEHKIQQHSIKQQSDISESDDDEFKSIQMDPKSQSLSNILYVPRIDRFAVSEPQKIQKLPSSRLKIRNSVSETTPFYFVEKEELMQKQTRESIEKALIDFKQDLFDIDDLVEIQTETCVRCMYTVKEPPLLPAIPRNLLFWNDATNDMQYAVCCTGFRMFHSGFKSGVYLYDLNTFNMQYLCGFPDNVYANSLGIAMDHKHNKLHLFGGKGLFGQWLILDIKAKIWDIRKDLSRYKLPFGVNMEHVKCIVIDGSLHIYLQGLFLRYNRRKHYFVSLDAIDEVKHIEYMFYVETQRRIYAFGGSVCIDGATKKCYDNIWFCQHNETFTEYIWHRMVIKLPYVVSAHEYDAILGSKPFIFVFYHTKKQVYCIDLVKHEAQMCDKQVAIEAGLHSKLMNTNIDMAHSLCMDHNGPTHVVIRLHDILSSLPIT